MKSDRFSMPVASRSVFTASLYLMVCGGCVNIGPVQRDLASIRLLLEEQNKRITSLDQEMHDGFRLALCRPEIRQLLDDVRNECTPIVDPKSPGAKNVEQTCDTKKIHPAVMSADPEHKGRFLKFMTLLRHEAFYMRPTAKEILRHRRERLEKLAALPVLKSTVFLVVAHPVVGEVDGNVEALRRGKLIADKLRMSNTDITPDRISIWIYAFPIGRNEVDNPLDLPGAGEPTDMNQSVWVFRADC